MTIKLTMNRVEQGFSCEAGSVPSNAATAAEVNAAIAKNPTELDVEVRSISEVQLRGIFQYAKLIDNGATTTTVESAIAALW